MSPLFSTMSFNKYGLRVHHNRLSVRKGNRTPRNTSMKQQDNTTNITQFSSTDIY